MKLAVLALGGLLTLAALLLAQETPAARDASWQAPPEAASQKNPVPESSAVSERAQKLYAENCAGCHGPKGAPSLKTATSFQQPLPDSDGALFWKISTGNAKRGMPSFNRLPERQRWELVSYIRTLSQSKSAQDNR